MKAMFRYQFIVWVVWRIFRRDQISSIAIELKFELTFATPQINKI